MEIIVRTTFNTHVYRWGGKLYRQKRGGPIGLRASGTVAKVTMEVWLKQLEQNLVEAGCEVFLMRKYVDDVIIIMRNMQIGARWMDGRVVTTEETRLEDMRMGRSREQVTLEALRTAANEIMGFLKFTGEASEGGKGIPVLDTTIRYGKMEADGPWFKEEDGQRTPGEQMVTEGVTKQVIYEFYMKPMTNKLGLLKRSALSENTKVSSASAEYMRRWKNCSLGLSKKQMEEITMDYSDALCGMGYPTDWIARVLKSTLQGYKKILSLMDEGKTKRNRLGKETAKKRRIKRVVGPQTWFLSKRREGDKKGKGRKGRGSYQDPEVVMFVPTTPGSQLKNMLTKMEEGLGLKDRVKYVEEGGTKMIDILGTKDPGKPPCGREECTMCQEDPGRCMSKGVVYSYTCLHCKEEEKTTQYIGESARTTWDRNQEHQKMMKMWDLKSPMVEHTINAHQGKDHRYAVKVEKTFKGNMQRQIKEGQMIGEFKGDTLLNRKGEWGQNLPPKFTMEDEDSYVRHEGRKRRQEEGCGDSKRQRRDSENDSGGGGGGGGRHTRETDRVTGDTRDEQQQRQTEDRDRVSVSLGVVKSGDKTQIDSKKVRPIDLFSGKIAKPTSNKMKCISFDQQSNKLTNYFSLSEVSGGEERGKVRLAMKSEVIKGRHDINNGVLIPKLRKHQALRKTEGKVTELNQQTSFSRKDSWQC